MFNRISHYVIATVAAAVTGIPLLMYLYQKKIIYANNYPQDSRTRVWNPKDFNMEKYDDLRIKTKDGVTIHAYYIPYNGVEGKASPVTLLYCHANSGNMGHRLSIVKMFRDTLRVNVLIFSYRGYGFSEGDPSESGIKLDTDAVLEYIKNNSELSKTSLILFGQSIGGAVAIYAASTAPANLAAIIVENTFFNLPRLASELIPAFYSFFRFTLVETWRSDVAISRVPTHVPVLFVCGDNDLLINNSHSKDLLAALVAARSTSSTSSLVVLPGGHNDTSTTPEYFEAIASFVFSHFPALAAL